MTYRTLASELDMDAPSRLTLENGETRAGFYRGCYRVSDEIFAIIEAGDRQRWVPIDLIVRAECVRGYDFCP